MGHGTAYGIGVGPGDPELLTLKALRLLQAAPVVAYPAPDDGPSFARSIVAQWLRPEQREIAIRVPMVAERFPAQEVYDRAAAEIGAVLAAGTDVAIICQGDPFFYGSFMYLFTRLADRFPVAIVPGVSSLTACAAAAGTPLAARSETLTVIPATLGEAELERRLAGSEAAAIIKLGRNFAKVRTVLTRLRLDGRARYVERASLPNQRILSLAEVADDSVPYFAMIVLPGPDGQKGRAVTATTLPAGAAIIVLGASAWDLAIRLKALLPGAAIHAPTGKDIAADASFADAAQHIAALFAAGTPIVGICAAGILVRAVAPVLADKRTEPPVVAVAEDGSSAVPLIGGHHGANALARAIAQATGGIAAITTAGDLRLGFSLDEPPPGWRIANPALVKPVTAALLAGKSVALEVEAGNADWLATPFAASGDIAIRITDRAVLPDDSALVLHPPVLALGVGCERGCTAEELIGLVEATLTEHRLAAGAIAAVVSLDLKADEPAVHELAKRLAVPARFFIPADLLAETGRLASPSDAVFRETGCYGVAEGAALAAVGPAGALLVAKRKSRRATCAIARSPTPLDAARIGRARGRLAIIGIGPGDAAWRTPEATAALAEVTEIVGYGLYLDLLGPILAGKTRHETGLGAETERARQALDLAATGRSVALVSSGDAGIYGLASLVFERIEREDRPDWRRIALTVIPGLSALQAAAARIGAPLGHDFCAISLSDLLTPWPTIERRLRAAADGDFVVALYNPRSQRRSTQLAAARDILLSARPPETPVALARNLGRPSESIATTTLAALDPDAVDMLTIVLIGSSQTRFVAGPQSWIYTPRGYAKLEDGRRDVGADGESR